MRSVKEQIYWNLRFQLSNIVDEKVDIELQSNIWRYSYELEIILNDTNVGGLINKILQQIYDEGSLEFTIIL